MSAARVAQPPPRSDPVVAIAFTVVEGRDPLTKSFGLDAEGRPVKTAAPSLSAGQAHRIECRGTATEILQAVAGRLEALGPREAIICAPPPSGRDAWRLVTKEAAAAMTEAERADVVTRTRRHFAYPAGPGLFALDVDGGAFPRAILDKLKAAGGLSAVLASVCPAIGAAACIARPSSSVGVVNRTTGAETPAHAGRHLYFVALDAGDAAAFATRLHRRLVLAGFGFAHVTAAGVIDVRSLIDVAASKGPERLWFEADAILADPALAHREGARKPTVRPGGFLDTWSLPDLSDEEREELAAIVARLRDEAAPEARRKRDAWRDLRRAELVRAGRSAEEADRAVAGLDVERRELRHDAVILLDDGRAVTVGEILDDPAGFDGKTCADPIEPEYGGGRNKAVIYADRRPYRIHSLAHGGIDYRLAWGPEKFLSDLDASGAEAIAARTANDLDADPWPANGNPVRTAGALPRLSVVAFPIDPAAIPRREWLVRPLIPRGEAVLLVGPPKAAKSAWCIGLGLFVASGDPRALFGDAAPPWRTRPARVVVVNNEDTTAEMHRRLAAAAAASGVAAPAGALALLSGADPGAQRLTILRRGPGGGIEAAPGRAHLARIVGEFRPDLVVVDSLASVGEGLSENDNADMDALAREIRAVAADVGAAVLIVHHTAKGKADAAGDMGAARGASALFAAVRAGLTLIPVSDDDRAAVRLPAGRYVRLDGGGANYSARADRPLVWRIESGTVGNGTADEPPPRAAAALFDDAEEFDAARGDTAPVFRFVGAVDFAAAKSRRPGRGRDRTPAERAAVVADVALAVLDGRRTVRFRDALPELGEALSREGIVNGAGESTIRGALQTTIGGAGVETVWNGQAVRVRLRSESAAPKAPLVIERIGGPRGADAADEAGGGASQIAGTRVCDAAI